MPTVDHNTHLWLCVLVCEGHATTIRLIGRVRGEHLEALKAQINRDGKSWR